MNEKFKNLFLIALNESEEDQSAGDMTPDEAFEGTLDDGTDPSDFDTEGVASLVDALCGELQEDATKLQKVIDYLVKPGDDNCMLKRLEKVQQSVEFEKLFQPIEKAIQKTAEALAVAITKIDVATTTAPSKRDRRQQEDIAKSATSQSPY